MNAAEVTIFTQYYTPEPIGTAPYAADLAEWLAQQGISVGVITNRPYYPNNKVLEDYSGGQLDTEIQNGVRIRRLRPLVPQNGSPVERLFADAAFFARALISARNPDARPRGTFVSFCPSVFTVVLANLLRRNSHRHVAVVHDIQSGLAEGLRFSGARYFGGALRLLEAWALNQTQAVIVLSQEMRDQLRRLGVTVPVVVLPIWVDTAAIYPLPRERSTRTLVYSGNLGKKQGLPLLLELAEVLSREHSDVSILVRGAGSQAHAMMDGARSRGLTNIEFRQLVPKEQLNEAIAEGDIHLVPQDPNAADFALPSKLYTIMAAGRPAIATANPRSALWRLAEESGAFLCVPPRRPREFAQAAIALLNDPKRRSELGEAGARYIRTSASRQHVLSAYQQFILGHGETSQLHRQS